MMESKSALYIVEVAAGAGRKVHTECEYNYVGFRNAKPQEQILE
jgi:hypothetical protein